MVDVHPVAALLTAKMRARVKAATFVKSEKSRMVHVEGNMLRCPLAVAVGRHNSDISNILKSLRANKNDEKCRAVMDFAQLADYGRIRPEDVKALLGCEDDDG